jgi:RNA polymerase sigma-70 factor (ECF subfamily)
MNAKEWPDIVRTHSPLVWRTVYRLVAHESDARDAFQETFVSAWEFAKSNTVNNWPGLLQRLATARALDLLRRKRRGAKHLTTSTDLGEIASVGNGPLATAQSAELAAQLREALADLPEMQSQIYCLRHLNELSYEEIAEEMEMTVSAVGVNLHRATERLRAALIPILTDDQHLR